MIIGSPNLMYYAALVLFESASDQPGSGRLIMVIRLAPVRVQITGCRLKFRRPIIAAEASWRLYLVPIHKIDDTQHFLNRRGTVGAPMIIPLPAFALADASTALFIVLPLYSTRKKKSPQLFPSGK